VKVFVLGESRTGTTSVHEYLTRCGLKAVHYFVPQCGVAEPIHKHRAANWPKVENFIETSGYDAFSDYPIRLFHRELTGSFPDAFYILTVRRDFTQWRESMNAILNETSDNFDLLQAYYLCYNEEIRCNCTDLGLRFLELTIEDDADCNARTLSDFLGLDYHGPLLRLNTTEELALHK
jgi:Sulfotransferase domain